MLFSGGCGIFGTSITVLTVLTGRKEVIRMVVVDGIVVVAIAVTFINLIWVIFYRQ
jgi:hypothetical protein